MSLLSDLLNDLPKPTIETSKPSVPNLQRPSAAMIERSVPSQTRAYTNAANATPEWRQARDLYINHVMTCRGCYAPGGRYCSIGAELRNIYEKTPMEFPV